MENNKTSNFGLDLATPGVPLSTLVTGNKNLETLDSKAMNKETFDPPEGGQEKGLVELAGSIPAFVGEVANKKLVVYSTVLSNGTYAQGAKANISLKIPPGTYLFTFSYYINTAQMSLYKDGALDTKNIFQFAHTNVVSFSAEYDVHIAFSVSAGGTIAFGERSSINFIKLS